ncbi:guanine-1-methyltransferase-domain-containing protein [Ampelomyces quisqualis]|uniref:tRNA (guanine(9)-N1)-methyltransferase n=1 Tax=Ampelomyces quisqualis TaxID=50730 RepID=A0A6A5R1I0_AMPQU|nr:guanine-1-methyltransferase-domain-containing protein [Ampelomyces quisqualis]
MDSDERPAKMRKFEHGDDEADDKIAIATVPVTAGETETTEATGDAPAAAGEKPKISKNQLKKQRRLERWEAGREDRKVKRKEKAKERKERKRENWKEQNMDENGNVPKMPPSRSPRHFVGSGTQVPITVIFDCDFEEYMYDHELKSLGLQITRCYSDNRKAKYKAHLALSSFGGKMKERFNGILAQQYTSWKGFQFFEEDFVEVAKKSKEWMATPQDDDDIGALAKASEGEEQAEHDASSEEGEIVYLSSESDNVLTHLKPNGTYIIGGLVDKNRHKGICHKRAFNRGIKTAKLPIKEYLEMRDRQVLVTNHVHEILLKWMEFGDWGKAFMEVMPKRKGGKLREDGDCDQDGSNAGEEEEEDPSEQEMEAAAKEAVEDAENTANLPETVVIETMKGLPIGETEAD